MIFKSRKTSSSVSKSRLRKRHKRVGIAAVEFAIVAPIFLLITFTMIEASRYLTAIHAVTGAARELVRLSEVNDLTSSEASTFAKEFMKDQLFKSDSVTVEKVTAQSGVANMERVTYTVSIEFADVSVVGDPFSFDVNRVNGTSSMLIPID